MWEFFQNNLYLVNIIVFTVVVLLLVFVGYAIFLIPKTSFIYNLWKDAKEIKDPLKYRKQLKQQLLKHSIVFASSMPDNDIGFKKIKKSFEIEEEIINVLLDTTNFDDIFDKYDIIIYKVHDSEFGIPSPSSDPLYKRISKYCSEQQKYCILVCKPGSSGLIALTESATEFNPVYVTTVQFYSKLRETLYILLYLA